jgi:hypothetical protein
MIHVYVHIGVKFPLHGHQIDQFHYRYIQLHLALLHHVETGREINNQREGEIIGEKATLRRSATTPGA